MKVFVRQFYAHVCSFCSLPDIPGALRHWGARKKTDRHSFSRLRRWWPREGHGIRICKWNHDLKQLKIYLPRNWNNYIGIYYFWALYNAYIIFWMYGTAHSWIYTIYLFVSPPTQIQTFLNLRSSETDRSTQFFATKTVVAKRGP